MSAEQLERKEGESQKLGNGYEYDCEPRQYTDAAKKQWASGIPDWAKSIGRKKNESAPT